MRITVLAFAAAGSLAACPAWAQSESAPEDEIRTAFVSDTATGSPSNATSTVSATTVPQAMERIEDDGDAFSLSLGALFAQGDFGTNSDTDIRAIALGARLRTGDLRLSASLPWMRIRSNATLFTGIDSTPVLVAPGTRETRTTNDGIGDLTLGAAYTLEPADSALELELSGRVKLSTASRSSGLSSGETDWSVGAQVARSMGRFAPFVSVTYRVLGDPAAFDLRDGFAASAGASAEIAPRTLILASYHYAEAATGFVEDSHELFAGTSTALGESGLRLTGFATAGLSRGAAGVSAGLAVSKAF